MTTEADRRTQRAQRIPFEALVEVGGAQGQPFEAQAINVSEDGMQLRTAYLPELGQPLTCRFDAGAGGSVLASGEVVWAQQGGKGGEFGIRFTDMDPESIESLRRMCGISKGSPRQAAGSKVRLHIEGLNSPMRARVKTSERAELTVGSDLGFLQVGKELDLEDAESGHKRPARIHGVQVEVDASSQVPQLIVMLRFADVLSASGADDMADEVRAGAPGELDGEDIEVEDGAAAAEAHAPPRDDGDLERVKRASIGVKGALTRGVGNIGPTFSRMASRAKTTIALLAAKRHTAFVDGQQRRTTAPAPGGGLHATGRKVIRGDSMNATDDAPSLPKPNLTKRKVAIGGAVLLAVTLTAFAMRKPHPATATADTAATSMATSAAGRTAVLAPTSMAAPLPPIAAVNAASMGGEEPARMADPTADRGHKGKPGKVTPFGNGAVAHGNLLHIKMDGLIDSIEGAQQPTGFTVHLPGRRSLEAAGPLTARDGRIASVKVSNDPNGAELTLTFKDGVPNYQVRAKGDTLEIALAPIKGTVAKKEPKTGAKHSPAKKTPHDTSPER